MGWRDHLQARLLEIRPSSVCALDAAAHHLLNDTLRQTPVRMPGQRSALALGIDVLNGLDVQQARHLISQTRLYTAPRMLIAAGAECALDAEAFRALGFSLSARGAAETLRLYEYDLDTYKTVPDWLNARYWAHPERWQP